MIFLLSLFDPLDQMRDHLAQEQEADQMEQVNDAIRSLQKQLQESQEVQDYAAAYSAMKPKQAAAIFARSSAVETLP